MLNSVFKQIEAMMKMVGSFLQSLYFKKKENNDQN
jgi:hypothetical protein